MTETVSVIIPTKNGGDLFKEVLQGLRNQSYPSLQIVVVDSGSSDGTVALAKSYGATVIEIAPHTFNHGLTRNFGIANSSGDIVVLMTQDAVPGDHTLIENLVRPFRDPEVAGSYARQVPRPDADVLTRRNLDNWITGGMEPAVRRIEDPSAYHAMSPIERYFLCNFDNVCSAVRRSAWDLFPFGGCHFGEDIDWSKRVLEGGWKIAYQPSAYVVHSHDRPVSYEFKRTYMCHRKLYELFRLHTVPELRYVLRSILYSARGDILYALKTEKNLPRLAALLLRIPLLSVACVWGQYKGARDEKLSAGVNLIGV